MEPRKSPFDLSRCARPNILALEPYRCARDDYKDDGTNILLDANENAYGPGLALNSKRKLAGATVNGAVNGDSDYEVAVDVDLLGLNRYPDPHQIPLKELLCNLRNTHIHTTKDLTPDNLFVGVGSDEAIDALLRCFCVPGRDKILTCPPTYGMYSVSAQVNDISLVKVPLIGPGFILDVGAINAVLSTNATIKLIYLCSPGNPTGQLLSKSSLKSILEHPTWNGVVVLDEAYIDFAPAGSSLAEWVLEWPNLVVMQTLSKAFGLAGIRLGAAFTSPPIARLLNALKAPYNISNPTSQLARAALAPENLRVMRAKRELVITQRDRLLRELSRVPGVGRFLGGTDANFLLVEILDLPREMGGTPCNVTALRVYEKLAVDKGVVVRFRGREAGCEGCLRVTVGTEREVDRFLKEVRNVLEVIFASRDYMPVNAVAKPVEEKEEGLLKVNDMVESWTQTSEIGTRTRDEPKEEEVKEEEVKEEEAKEEANGDEIREEEVKEEEVKEEEAKEEAREEANGDEIREGEIKEGEAKDEVKDEVEDEVNEDEAKDEVKGEVKDEVKDEVNEDEAKDEIKVEANEDEIEEDEEDEKEMEADDIIA